MAKISGIVFTNPHQYLVGNPFYFMTEFDKWFWFMKVKYFDGKHWFVPDEIPMERCEL